MNAFSLNTGEGEMAPCFFPVFRVQISWGFEKPRPAHSQEQWLQNHKAPEKRGRAASGL